MRQISIALFFLLSSFSVTAQAAAGDDLKLTETDDTIRVMLRGKPVLRYIKKAQPVPEGTPEYSSRSGYIHPVYTPTGQELTGDYPADHAHQHALFFAWVKSKFDGQKVDFWNQAKDLGRIEFRKVVNLRREERKVAFTVKHAFMVKDGDKWIDALHETWNVTVHQTPADHFLFDIVSVQQCASDKPLGLAEYHYGGMAIRGNYQWLKEKEDHSIHSGDLQFLTSEGKDRWEGNHTRPTWILRQDRRQGGIGCSVLQPGELPSAAARPDPSQQTLFLLCSDGGGCIQNRARKGIRFPLPLPSDIERNRREHDPGTLERVLEAREIVSSLKTAS